MWISRREIARVLTEKRELKAKVLSLEDELRAERDRNRRREDDLVNQVLLASGRYGIENAKPKEKKVETGARKRRPLTGYEEGLRVSLRQAAVAAGRSPQEGEMEFWAQIEGKPSTASPIDEPYIVPIV